MPIHSLRWRNSFLFSLLFGVPVMVIMAYFMIDMARADCSPVPLTNATANHSTDGHGAEEDGAAGGSMGGAHCGMKMVMPGLSWENLLLFLFCTPCQVCEFISSSCVHPIRSVN
jgi:hypothetical protein